MTLADSLKAECLAKGLRYVGGRGDPHSPCWVLGEAPGEHEEQALLPFIGPSGREQDRMMSEAGFKPHECYFTNPYKVRPPDNDLSKLETLGIQKPIYEAAFLEELRTYHPAIIICAGATSLSLLCPILCNKRGELPISKYRGSLLTSPLFDWSHYVIPVYHPAFILREWTERQVSVFCYARAKEELSYWRKNGKLQPLPERQFLTEPSYEDTHDYLSTILQGTERVSIDIEMLQRKHVSTIGLAKSPNSAISFGLYDFKSLDQTAKIWRLLDRILRNKRQIGQNYVNFDCCWLESIGFQPRLDLVEDTLIRHHILWPELEHSLQFMTIQYTRQPFYKNEGRKWVPRDGKAALQRYNAMDCAVTYEVYLRQEEEFVER